MATEDNFIVAIELGSSKVTGVAGRKQPDGAIQVLAFAQEPSTTFIRKGRINNVSKMTQCIISMREKLEQKMQKSVSRVYVGIGGMGMHTVANTVARHFDSKVEITQEMVDAISDENRTSANADRDILESVPQEYHLGAQTTIDPVGILADSIEGHYLNIVANSSVREEIRNCFRTAGVTIADLPITVQALADSMLTEPEKRSGCVFVDMGAETTSVAVYKNNLLRHLAVIPLGGANINRDIMSLQIEDDEAEELKLKYGSAVQEGDSDAHKPIALRDGRTIAYDEFMGLVEARVEEIVLNVKNQISLSNYDVSQLIGGLIVTGGAANIRNIDKAFTRDTKFEKIRFVRSIRIPLRTPDYPGLNNDGDCNAAIALIDKGEINCCGGDLGQPDLFDDPKDAEPEPSAEELAAAEAKKKAEEAEAQRKAEEEARIKAEIDKREREREEREEAKRNRRNKWKNSWKRMSNFFGNLVKEDSGDDA
ncbi:cell division protein FtsA [uncultured Prevotellamassilia sp.]|uniref:cell division protein FtsA n=1 Tax=uncultured Prevotellamassilia sp. TaxID=1926676 RepID=UPI00258D7870|nr:cell division protein FtsA [uncultured Prevotellamassilia sp.]